MLDGYVCGYKNCYQNFIRYLRELGDEVVIEDFCCIQDHQAADLTLVMSHALGKEMNAAGASTAEKIRIWQKGVDSESFHTRFKSQEMRNHLTVMGGIPHIRLAFVGDGPFSFTVVDIQGMNVTFTGMLQGEELSQAYASADIFITPSESETLGFVVLEA
ncbi:unnamed protein product [Sphagnum troendelagicum]